MFTWSQSKIALHYFGFYGRKVHSQEFAQRLVCQSSCFKNVVAFSFAKMTDGTESVLVEIDAKLTGDRICVSPSWLRFIKQDQVLIFSIKGARECVGSAWEFTAPEGQILVAPFLFENLNSNRAELSILQPPKCQYIKLVPSKPIDAIKDIRSLLESHLRKNYSVLKKGDVIPLQVYNIPFEFQITDMKPEDVGVVINTDVEVDLEYIKMQEKLEWTRLSTHAEWTWSGFIDENQFLQIPFYNVKEWKEYAIQLQCDTDVNLYVSDSCPRPSRSDHLLYNVERGRKECIYELEGDIFPFLNLGLEPYDGICMAKVTVINRPISVKPLSPLPKYEDEEIIDENMQTCKNCGMKVPAQTISMHEAFCFRNNIKCTKCNIVFQKKEFSKHWHCESCEFVGVQEDQKKHHELFHVPVTCSCGVELSLNLIGQHKKIECPDRLIVCRFCHLLVRAGGKSMNVRDLYLGTGLTEHESECGSRTIQCQKCKKSVQLKDMQTHAKIHELQDKPQVPTLCSNVNCANELSSQYPNSLKMCSSCFQPFWSPRHDPGNQKLAQLIVQTYHRQMTLGCKNSHCYNKVSG
jgi:hypothetical protein